MSPTIGDTLGLANQLETASDSPLLDVQQLLAHVLDKPTSHIYAHQDSQLTEQQTRFFMALLQRRMQGEPVAYLTGSREFWSINLKVGPAVLIPRPETELLIELALSLPQELITTVIDLGTGSGAIAISLAKERPAWDIFATDIEEETLAIAQENADVNNTRIKFISGHWFDPTPAMRFDLIVSNPPYVKAGDPHLARLGLGYEPGIALVSGADGLTALREIITGSTHHLKQGGWIILEHGYDQSSQVCAMLKHNGYHNIEVHKDLAGIDRAVLAQFKTSITYR